MDGGDGIDPAPDLTDGGDISFEAALEAAAVNASASEGAFFRAQGSGASWLIESELGSAPILVWLLMAVACCVLVGWRAGVLKHRRLRNAGALIHPESSEGRSPGRACADKVVPLSLESCSQSSPSSVASSAPVTSRVASAGAIVLTSSSTACHAAEALRRGEPPTVSMTDASAQTTSSIAGRWQAAAGMERLSEAESIASSAGAGSAPGSAAVLPYSSASGGMFGRGPHPPTPLLPAFPARHVRHLGPFW